MNKIIYLLIRLLTFPLAFLPFWMIHSIGKPIGTLAYYVLPKFRKRTLSNLALAKDLNLTHKQLRKTAIKSFQNLTTVLIEYPKLSFCKNLDKHIICTNPELLAPLLVKKQGTIFFVAHQANWEVLFLYGTKRTQGLAIGKPINNKHLYKWVLSIRERFGGKIVEARSALKESIRALKKGHFVGIVGDQGMPTSEYSYPFLGTSAKNTTAPALLAYKTNSPLVFAETRRESSKYKITLSPPLYPNKDNPIEEEVPRMMNKALFYLEESIKKCPHQWLWQHNRYKQLTPELIYKPFRHESILIVLPLEKELYKKIVPHIPLLLKIYKGSFITLLVPEKYKVNFSEKVIPYKEYKDTLLNDYQYKLVFNFTPYEKIASHYKKLAALKVLSMKSLRKKANSKENSLAFVLKKVLCRKSL
jgi:KDO2-lipid IV(A) lauroyltransferase